MAIHIEITQIDPKELYGHSEGLVEVDTLFSAIGNTVVRVPVCALTVHFERADVPQSVVNALNKLAHGELPEGSADPPVGGDWSEFPGYGKNGAFPFVPLLDDMPQALRQFVLKLISDLVEACNRLIGLVGWRENFRTHAQPLYHGMLFWKEREQWIEMPTARMEIPPLNPPRNLQLTNSDLQQLVEAAESEPAARNLLRDAWELCMFNTRGALVLGVAAAEIGSKQCVVSLAGDTEWLLDSRVAPPVEDLVWKLIPRFEDRYCIQPVVIAPPAAGEPDRLREELRAGVMLRNQLAHQRPVQPSIKRTRLILDAISDLLYFFDYVQGEAWAIDFISLRTRHEWKVDRMARDS